MPATPRSRGKPTTTRASCKKGSSKFEVRSQNEEGLLRSSFAPRTSNFIFSNLVHEGGRIIRQHDRIPALELHLGDALSAGAAHERAVGGALIDGENLAVARHDAHV